jgi:hypothetical protein
MVTLSKSEVVAGQSAIKPLSLRRNFAWRPNKNGHGYGVVAEKRETTKVSTIVLALLMLSTLGLLYGNIAVLRVFDFVVTLPFLSFGIATILVIFLPRSQTSSNGITVLIWICLVIGELQRALSLGIETNTNWQRSVALYFYCSLCFVLTSRLRVSRDDILKMRRLLKLAALLFGALGILQFSLFNVWGIKAMVPVEWAVSKWNPAADVYRTGLLQRAAGISAEPSYYAIGLVLLATLIVFVETLANVKRFTMMPYAFILGGSIVSFSIGGWFLGVVVIVTVLLVGHLHIRYRILILTCFSLALISYCVRWPSFIVDRIDSAILGLDRSATIRGTDALRLLTAPPTDVMEFVNGKGLGQEETYRTLIAQTYDNYEGTEIHNIFSVIKVTQGWLGVGLQIMLLLSVLRPFQIRNWWLYCPLTVAIIGFHFVTGLYLNPVYWALLALSNILQKANLACEFVQTRASPCR